MNNTEQTEGYWQMAKYSYANQEGGITIPTEKLGEIVEIPLGFQPLGISATGNRFALADYFAPAVCLGTVSKDEKGLHIKTEWVRGAQHGIQSVRLFPDISQPSGANRCQTANLLPDGRLVVSRNCERDFYVFSPPSEPKGRWTLTEKRTLPLDEDGRHRFVHSAKFAENEIITIEFLGDIKQGWSVRHYGFPEITTGSEKAHLPSYRYGIFYGTIGATYEWTVTSFETDKPPGIYHGDLRVLTDICGTGLCQLPDDMGVLVSRYGQGYKGAFNGLPGALIYVPLDKLRA